MANSLFDVPLIKTEADQFSIGNLIEDYLRSDITGALPADSPYTMRRGDVDEARRTAQLLSQLPPGQSTSSLEALKQQLGYDSTTSRELRALQDATVPGYPEQRQTGNISRLQAFEQEQLLAENHRTEVARAERMKLVLNSAKDKRAFETFFAANSGTTAKDLSPATKKSLEAWRNRFVGLWDKLAGIPADKMTQVQSSWATEEIEELVRSVPRYTYKGLSGPTPTASQPLLEESFLKKLLTLPIQGKGPMSATAEQIGDYVTNLKQSGSAMWAEALKTPEAEMIREAGGVLDPRPSPEEAAAVKRFYSDPVRRGTEATLDLLKEYIGISPETSAARRELYEDVGKVKDAVVSAPFDAWDYVNSAIVEPFTDHEFILDEDKSSVARFLGEKRDIIEGQIDAAREIPGTVRENIAEDVDALGLSNVEGFSEMSALDRSILEQRGSAPRIDPSATTGEKLASMLVQASEGIGNKIAGGAENAVSAVANVSRPVLEAVANTYRGFVPDAFPPLDPNRIIKENLNQNVRVGGADNVQTEAASAPTEAHKAVLDGARLWENLTTRKEEQAAEKQTRGLLDFVIGRESAQKIRDAVGYEKDFWQAPGTGILSVLQNMMANPLASAPGVSGWGQIGYAGDAARRSAAAGAIAAQEASAKSATAQAALINANAPRQIKEAGNLKILRNIGTMHSMTDIIAKYKDLLTTHKLTGGGAALQGTFIKAARLLGIDIGSTPKETLQMMSQSLQELFTELYGQQVSKREMKALEDAIEDASGPTGALVKSDVHILAQLNNLLEKITRDQKTFSSALNSQGYSVQVDAMAQAHSTDVDPETMAIISRTDRQ